MTTRRGGGGGTLTMTRRRRRRHEAHVRAGEYVAKNDPRFCRGSFRLSFFPHLTDSQPLPPSHFLDSPTRTFSATDLTTATDSTTATNSTTATDSTTVMNSTMATDSTMKRRAQCQREGFGNGGITPAYAPTSQTQQMRPIGDTCGASNPRQGRETTRRGGRWGYNNNEVGSDTTTRRKS